MAKRFFDEADLAAVKRVLDTGNLSYMTGVAAPELEAKHSELFFRQSGAPRIDNLNEETSKRHGPSVSERVQRYGGAATRGTHIQRRKVGRCGLRHCFRPPWLRIRSARRASNAFPIRSSVDELYTRKEPDFHGSVEQLLEPTSCSSCTIVSRSEARLAGHVSERLIRHSGLT